MKHRASVSRLVRRFSGSAAVTVAGALLAFAVAYVAIAVLGKTGFGEYAIAVAVLELITLPLVGSLRLVLLRELDPHRGDDRPAAEMGAAACTYVIGLVRWLVVGAVALIIVGGGAAYLVTDSGVWLAMMVGATGVPFVLRAGLARARLLVADQVVPAQRPDQIDRRLAILFAMGALLIVFGEVASWVGMVVYVGGSVVAALASSRQLRKSGLTVPHSELPLSREQRAELRTSFATLAVSQLSTNINTRADTIMIGALASVDEAALYAVARRLFQMLGLPFTSARVATFPLLAQLRAQAEARGEQWRRLAGDLRMMSFAGFATTAIGALVVLAVPQLFLSVFGDDFGTADTALRLFAVQAMVNALAGPVGAALSIHGYERIVARWVVLSAVLNIGLNAVLIVKWGAAGAALASLISAAVWNVALVGELVRRTGIWSVFVFRSHDQPAGFRAKVVQ